MSKKHEFGRRGWNTLDVRSLAAVVHLPAGLEVRVGLLSESGDLQYRELRWPEMKELGPHTPDCSYAAVTLEVTGCRMLVEFASEGDVLAVRAVPLENPGRLRPFAEVFLYSGFGGVVSCAGETAAVSTESAEFVVHPVSGGFLDRFSTPMSAAYEAGSDGVLTLVITPERAAVRADDAAAFIEDRKAEALSWEKRFEDPDRQAAFEGMWRSVVWNTIFAPSISRPVTVVSRDWCVDGNYGDFVLFEWDTFFAALQSSTASRELAYANVRAVLSGVTERAFVPSIFCELGKSRDRSMLPVGSEIVLKLYERFGDKDFLQEVFPSLLAWHDWWMTARDGNGDGLLEWGSDDFPSPHPQWQSHTLQAARYESGLDNSPMYDDVEFDLRTNTMTQIDVGLNAAYAMDAWALARIAEELDNREQADHLTQEHEAVSRRINDVLWSEEDGIYLNRRWDSSFSRRLSPTLFYPLIGRVATPERARRMVEEHLLNKEEFWGEHVIPSISRNDPAYPDQEYWRGRIWGPMNWLVYEGLKAYGLGQAAREMGEKCLRTFLNEWTEESHVHENYNGDTGEGDDARYSEPVYFWGGLLALIGLLESGATFG